MDLLGDGYGRIYTNVNRDGGADLREAVNNWCGFDFGGSGMDSPVEWVMEPACAVAGGTGGAAGETVNSPKGRTVSRYPP